MNKARWEDAIHFKPTKFEMFWEERLSQNKKDILLIAGLGWDPRMTVVANTIQQYKGSGLRHLLLILFRRTPNTKHPYSGYINKNIAMLEPIKKSQNWNIEKKKIFTMDNENKYRGDSKIIEVFKDYDLSCFTDILIDISSLPGSLYFTLINLIVKKVELEYKTINVHILTCQDVDLDYKIMESSDHVRFLRSFAGNMIKTSQRDVPVMWAPVIINNKADSLELIYNFLSPTDIYPVLPFPARNPRFDDDLLIEYKKIFADQWQLNPMNFIYAAEDDPVDIYLNLLNLSKRLEKALKSIGGFSMAISSLAGKLSSIGAFMAVYEGKMAVVQTIGRHTPPSDLSDSWNDNNMKKFQENLHSIWLTGEPYL